MKNFLIVHFLFTTIFLSAQDFEWLGVIKNQKAYVRVFSEDAVVIILQKDDSQRFVSAQLPKEWKKDGLKFTFTGRVGKIPPHMRLIGTPLKLISICTTKAEAQKYGLKKTSYKFKQ